MEYFMIIIKRLHSFSGRVLYWNILGMGLMSFFEGIGTLLLIPMITLSGMLTIDNRSNAISTLISFIHIIPGSFRLATILIIYILITVGQNLVEKNLTMRNVKISQGFISELRLDIYRDILHADWSFYTKKRKSDLINIMTIELARVAGGINQFLQMFASIIFTIIQICLALWLSAKMTLFVLVSSIFLGFFSKKYITQSKRLGTQSSLLAQEYLAGITDQMNGIKDIKSNTMEVSRLAWLERLVGGMYKEQIEYTKLRTNSQLFYKIASSSLIAIIIFLSFKLFNAQPEQFLLISIIFSRLWPRITAFQSGLEQIASTLPAFKSLIELQLECKSQTEGIEEKSIPNAKPMEIKQGIECQGVCFRYNAKEPIYAIQNINLTIPAKQMTAIVGRSGAGKSTLIDILLGLNKPEKGQIFVDGLQLTNQNVASLRKSISYVAQEPFLFNSTIRENLLLVEPNSSEADMWAALEFSAASEFVKNLPNGLDTIIGDRGIRLSGGERQRVVLARAILRKPAILILDEATSALDTENESKIQEALERIRGTMTIIVIAHRLSTIRNADQVIVLEEGKIIQNGLYAQLASEKRGMFRKLLRTQTEVSV